MTLWERRGGAELAQRGGNARSDPRIIQEQRVVSGEGSRPEALGHRRQEPRSETFSIHILRRRVAKRPRRCLLDLGGLKCVLFRAGTGDEDAARLSEPTPANETEPGDILCPLRVLVQYEPAATGVEGGEVPRAEPHHRDAQRLQRLHRSWKVQDALRARRDYGDRMASEAEQIRRDVTRIPAMDPTNTVGSDHVDPHGGRSEHRRRDRRRTIRALGDRPSKVSGCAFQDLTRPAEALNLLRLQAHLHPSRNHPNGGWDRSGDPHGILE